MKICVTGASGKLGRATVADLREHGHTVVAVDLQTVVDMNRLHVVGADLRDAGQAAEVVAGCDAVVHLANIPAPGLRPATQTFNDNMTMNFNVFHAAVRSGVQRVVWASSETTLGLPFSVSAPLYAPVDEDHYPHPTTTYALSKVASETVADELAGWSGIPFVALRFTNVFEPGDYAGVPAYWADALLRSWNLWGYVDVRDAAAACRLALDADVQRTERFVVAAADTIMNRPSSDLMAEVFPEVELRRSLAEHETLLSIDHARERLGYAPAHSWRAHVDDH